MLRPPAALVASFLSALLAIFLGSGDSSVLSPQTPLARHSSFDPRQDILELKISSAPQLDPAIIADRPLMAKGRRAVVSDSPAPEEMSETIDILAPAPSPDQAPEVAQVVPPEIRLVGVVLTTGTRRALVQSKGDKTERWLGVGDTLMGWVLVEITQSRVVLRAGEGEISIQMFD